jgi:hypothetical protein
MAGLSSIACFKKYSLPLLGLLLTVISSACSPAKISLDGYGHAIHTLKPETVLEEMIRPDQGILMAVANIEVTHEAGRYSTKAALLIKRPSSLRVEAIPVIGPVYLFLSIHEDSLKMFLPQKEAFYIGKATTENLIHIANFLATGLSTEDLLSIMLGTYPRVREKNVLLKGFMEGHLYRVDMVAEGRKLQSIWVDPSTHHLVEVRVFKDSGSASYTAMFEGFDDTSGSPAIPLKVTLISEMADNHPSKVIIRYSSVQFASDVDAFAFDLQVPQGVAPIYLD